MSEPQPETEPEAADYLIGTLTIREFMSMDGESVHHVDADGDLPLAHYLGLLELAKMWLIAEHDIEGDPDDDEDDD